MKKLLLLSLVFVGCKDENLIEQQRKQQEDNLRLSIYKDGYILGARRMLENKYNNIDELSYNGK